LFFVDPTLNNKEEEKREGEREEGKGKQLEKL
jgi:hypothetical protein